MSLRDDPDHPGKHIDSDTGIWPIAEWGNECGRGFVSDARFSGGKDRVIKRANRGKTRKWYGLRNRPPANESYDFVSGS